MAVSRDSLSFHRASNFFNLHRVSGFVILFNPALLPGNVERLYEHETRRLVVAIVTTALTTPSNERSNNLKQRLKKKK